MARITDEERIKIDNAIVDFLYAHKGECNKVSGAEILDIIRSVSTQKHKYTSGIAPLVHRIMIERKLPICHSAGAHGGYFWAETKEELVASC